MKKIILIRHGESLWNQDNRFTGWIDVDLTEKGLREAAEAGNLMRKEGIELSAVYTSVLKRAIKSANAILDEMDLNWIPLSKTWRLNEKHYGMLQGLNKKETAREFGNDQVLLWRRSVDISSPPLPEDDFRSPYTDEKYKHIPKRNLPLTESLKDTIERIIPYWEEIIFPSLNQYDTILIVAHSNSLRGIVKHIKNISDKKIIDLNIPTAVPYVFEFDEELNFVKDYYLGDPEKVEKMIREVENQGVESGDIS